MDNLSKPQAKLVIGTTTYDSAILITGSVIRPENGFDTATVVLANEKGNTEAVATKGTAISIYVKDQSEPAWTTIFTGIIRYTNLTSTDDTLELKCDGSGYPLAESRCCEEYGSQSDNPTLHHVAEIIENADHGIVPAHVNHILGNTANDSGYNITTTIDAITDEIKYFYVPYKPCTKTLVDLCDLTQALKGAAAGPHFIVTPAGNLILTIVGTHSAAAIAAGWPLYMNGTQAAATIVQGEHFVDARFETLTPEANYILYHGQAYYPVGKDTWTENTSTLWDAAPGSVGDDAVNYKIGAYSIYGSYTGAADSHIWYPKTEDLGLNLSALGGKYTIPTVNFWFRRDAQYDSTVPPRLIFNTSNGPSGTDRYTTFFNWPSTALTWEHYTLPVGPYWKYGPLSSFGTTLGWAGGWSKAGAGDWADINSIEFNWYSAAVTPACLIWIDNLHFEGWVLRGAKYTNPAISSTNPIRIRLINDDMAKYDTLKATDDSGSIGQLAKAELYRCKTTPTIGVFNIPIQKSGLPGQLVHVHADPNRAGTFQIDDDYRITRLIHSIGKQFATTLEVTSDKINSIARTAYDDMNTRMKAIRPEYQDRQATSVKSREIDITQIILESTYP